MKNTNNTEIVFYGDPHGDYRELRGIAAERPKAVVFLGDMDLESPLEDVVEPLTNAGVETYFIHGNHDTDREHWHDNLFNSKLRENNLSCKVVKIGDVRIAGLGGVFRSKVWHPKDGVGLPRFKSRVEYLRANKRNAWRGSLPLSARSTIFPEDLDGLSALRADILVTHEAPSSHIYGFAELDLVAEMLGVHTIIHGHHHESSFNVLQSGIKVICLDKAETLKAKSHMLLNGDWSDVCNVDNSYCKY